MHQREARVLFPSITISMWFTHEPEPVTLDKTEVKYILAASGVQPEKLEELEEHYEASAGEKTEFLASNVMSARKFEIKTPDIVIQVNPERADLVETRMIDGRQCLVIGVDDHVEVNGIFVKTIETEQVKLVTSIRGNSLDGRISIESPLGKAILGRKVGERVHVQVSEGYGYEVVIKAIDKSGDDGDDICGF